MPAEDVLGLPSLVLPEPDAVVHAPGCKSHRIFRYIQRSDTHRVSLENARNFVLVLFKCHFCDRFVLSPDQNGVLFPWNFLQSFANVHDVRDLSVSFWGDLVGPCFVGISEGSLRQLEGSVLLNQTWQSFVHEFSALVFD